MLQTLTANIVGAPKPRVLHGRNYLVFKVVPLVEGVHSGSNGPVFYPYDEIEKWVKAWNHKPAVVNHPKNESGEFISANENPETLEAYGVGMILANAAEEAYRRQIGEAWLEVSRLDRVYDGLSKMLREGLVMEVSTGLFSDNEQKAGEFNGTKYNAIARNFRPDHLALLPDLVGACSVKDGCGLFTAAQAAPAEKMEEFKEEMDRAWTRVFEGTANCKCGGTCHKSKGESEMKLNAKQRAKHIDSLVASELWDEEDREYLESLECDKLLKHVEKLEDNEEEEDPPKKKKKIANTDREAADKARRDAEDPQNPQDQGQPDKPGESSDPSKQVDRVKSDKDTQVPGSATDPGNKGQQTNAYQEWLKTIPSELRDFVDEGVQANAANRSRLIETIMENEDNEFEEDELKTMKTPMLKKLASLAVGPGQKHTVNSEQLLRDFTANAGGVRNGGKKTTRVLDIPSTNVKREETKK